MNTYIFRIAIRVTSGGLGYFMKNIEAESDGDAWLQLMKTLEAMPNVLECLVTIEKQ